MPTTAAAYPFIASQKTYTDLVGGTVVTFTGNDDGYAQNIPIGFTFPFCTGNYTAIHACTNGWISFNPTSTGTSLSNLATSTPDAAIFPLWDDLSVNPGGNVKYLTTGTAPNRIFTIEYKGVQWYYNNSTPFNVIDFQVKLYEGGVIECIYKQGPDPIYLPGSAGASIGIKNTGSADFQTLPVASANPTPSSVTFNTGINTKPATGQSYVWGKIPCSGVPTTSVVVPQPVCKGKPFTLTLSGLSLLSDLSYQWQESADGVNWINFTGTGGTNPAITDIINAPKYYRCIVTCANSSQSYITPGVLVNLSPFYYCYCATGATATAGVDIGNVTITSLPSNTVLLNNGTATPVENNTSSNKTYSEFRYAVPPIPMYKDSSYKFSLSQINSGTFTPSVAAIFIDYNRNGTFDDSERIFQATPVNVLPDPGLVTLPSYKLNDSAGYGLTGMRVVIKAGTSDPDTCGNYTNGETEDYLVDLRYVPCSGKPAPGVIEGDTSMCIGYKYILTDSTYQRKKHGVDRYWQVSPDAVVWTDIAGSANKDTLTRIFTGQPLFYRVVITCSHTNDTDYTAPHKVNMKPSYKCYCFSQSTGTMDDTSDIGAFKLSTFEVSDNGTHLLNPKAFHQRTDYTDLAPIKLDVDSFYKFYVFHTMPYNNHADGKITVFVDFNNNKQYDIPEERIYTGFTSIGNHVRLGNLIIPNNVIVNMPTGLRVIINNDVAPNIPSDEACGTYLSGETEDFIVEFYRPFGVAVKEADGLNQLSLSPNPTTGRFQVQFKGSASENGVSVKVTTVTGQLVKQEVYPHSGGIFRQVLDLGNEAKGIYMVEVSANGHKMIQKITVQ